jgi:phosphatidylinositol glycan class B
LPTILVAAFLVRVGIACWFQNIIAPDEVFQALEQAHRLVYGQGVVPWEFQVGLRCWLIPLVLAAPMAAAHWVGLSPLGGLVFIRVLLCAASLGVVACAVKWGERFYGREGAWIAGLFTAFWPDLWLMAPHPLEEVLAADVLLPAVYLVGTAVGLQRVAWAGLLLGLAFTLRMQLAPAVALAGIVLCGRDARRWVLALAAAALPVLAAGLLDWFSWGQPFRSFWLNIYLNVVLGVAKSEFGAGPPSYFVYMMGLDWLWTLPVFLLLVWRGGRKLWLPGTMAVLILLTHMLIAHKEYRFIFPAIALVAPLAGLGLAELLTRLRAAGRLTAVRLMLGMFLLVGPLASPWLYFMLSWQARSFHVFTLLAADHPRLVSLQGWDHTFHSFLPFDIVFTGATRLTSETITPAAGAQVIADAIIATEITKGIPAIFTRPDCYPGQWIPFAKILNPHTCIWRGAAAAGNILAAPAFVLPFPKAAKPYIIPDRLVP